MNTSGLNENVHPMHWAAWAGRDAELSELCSAGNDVNVEDGDGQTPLDYAKERGRDRTVRLLVKRGAKMRKILTVEEAEQNGRLVWHLRAVSGDILYTHVDAGIDERVGSLRAAVQHKLNDKVVLLNPSGYEMGPGSYQECLRECMKRAPETQKRMDPNDEKPYCKQQFLKYYGCELGRMIWKDAPARSEPIPGERAESDEETNGSEQRAEVWVGDATLGIRDLRSMFGPEQEEETVMSEESFVSPDEGDVDSRERDAEWEDESGKLQ